MQQVKIQIKINRQQSYPPVNAQEKLEVSKAAPSRYLHRSFQDELSHDEAQQRIDDEEKGQETHKRSSICATGFATSARPMTTRAIPHQRRVEINSPKNIQQPSGTRISTTRERGKAIVSGMYLRT